MSKFEGGQRVLVEGTVETARFGESLELVTVAFGESGVGWGKLRVPDRLLHKASDLGGVAPAPGSLTAYQVLAQQQKHLHDLLNVSSHQNAALKVESLVDLLGSAGSKPAPQPALAPGECWVRAKLVYAQSAYERDNAVVQFTWASCNTAVPKADVLQGDPPVPETAVDAALAPQWDQVYNLLGVKHQATVAPEPAPAMSNNATVQMLVYMGVSHADVTRMSGQERQQLLAAMQDRVRAAAAPVHATKISAEPDVASMTEAQRASLIGPNRRIYGSVSYNRWVPGQGWCIALNGQGPMLEGCCSTVSPCSHQQRDPYSLCSTCAQAAGYGLQPTAPASPLPALAAARGHKFANTGHVQAQTPPAATTAQPLTAEQLAKVRAGDHVLVRVQVGRGYNLSQFVFLKICVEKGLLEEVGQVVGHEPAPPKPVEAGCRATTTADEQVIVLAVDGADAWVKRADGVKFGYMVSGLTRLLDA